MIAQLEQCVVLGGSGCGLNPGQEVNVRFEQKAIAFEAARGHKKHEIFYPELVDLEITGPGSVTTGGGFMGGGFGAAGALEGMAVASILNAMTTKTQIHTFMKFTTHQGEVFVHYGGLEPAALRIALSEVFVHLRRLDPDWFDTRLRRLEAVRRRELINEEEFQHLKSRLLASGNSGAFDKARGEIWQVLVDRRVADERRDDLIAALRDTRLNEVIATVSDREVKLATELTLEQANALMGRLHGLAVVARKQRIL